MINSAQFIKRLEKIMEFSQLTATGFAEEISFNRSTISHLLSGRNKPSLEFVLKVVEKFPEVTMDWLLFGKGSFPTSNQNQDSISNKNKSDLKNGKSTSLPSRDKMIPEQNYLGAENLSGEIERIIFFYKNGSFKIYEN